MYLSNRLTFSLVFSVLLVAAFALVVAPAMADVMITAHQTVTDYDGTASPVVPGMVVFTFMYSEKPSPMPDISHFTANDNEISDPPDTDEKRDVLTAATATVGGKDKTVTLTFTNATGNVTLPAGLQLKGYSTFLNGVTVLPKDPAPGQVSPLPTDLELMDGYIAGKAYVVYGRGGDGAPRPQLPAGIELAYIQSGDEGNSNVDMPNLEEFFSVGGGTIDLKVAGTGANSRQVVINEVMWAVDYSSIGTAGYIQQQWIEVYNTTTTPAKVSFVFINNESGLNPPPAVAAGTSDRLSNIPSYVETWNVKGQNGSYRGTEGGEGGPILDKNLLKSMYRNNQSKNGWNAAQWTESDRPYLPGFHGTPGKANTRGGIPGARPAPTRFTPPKSHVVINELYNGTEDMYDWLELRAIQATNIENWTLSMVSAVGTETEICRFPKYTIPGGEVLLIVNTDPRDTYLAIGQQIGVAAENQSRGAGMHKYAVVPEFKIPDDGADDGEGNYLLILRTGKGWERWLSRDRLHDAVGPKAITLKTRNVASPTYEAHTGNPGQIWETQLYPLNGWSGIRAHDAGGSNNTNAFLQPDRTFTKGKAWVRTGNNGFLKDGISPVGYKNGIGYGRNAPASIAVGTPGYDNGIVKGKTTELGEGRKLFISELMLTTDNGRYPQYIELYNNSDVAIDFAADGSDPKDGWHMIVENYNSGTWKSKERPLYVDIKLMELFSEGSIILPRQTMLIVSDKSRNSKSNYFPSNRVASIWERKQGDFKMANRRDSFLNAEGGFYIKIIDGDGNVADEIGNLDGKEASTRHNIPIDSPVGFDWPTALTKQGYRTSLIRIVDGGTRGVSAGDVGIPGMPRVAVSTRDAAGNVTDAAGAVIPIGVSESWRSGKYAKHAWVHAVDTKMAFTRDTWYGANTDHGTPGHTSGTPLPVSLSFFRPTLEEGKVVIRWTTESELDNAGFNILRSDRNGEFTQVNEQLIQGKGTTAERSTYKWVDTTAKPGAVYYYQIQDVSFAGEHNTLATTKLKGLISAKGKLTTSWGDIKNASQ